MRSILLALLLLVVLGLSALGQGGPPPCMQCERPLGVMYYELRGGMFCSKECAEAYMKRPPTAEQVEAQRKAAAEAALREAELKAAADARARKKRSIAVGIGAFVLAGLAGLFVVSARAAAPPARPPAPPTFQGPRGARP